MNRRREYKRHSAQVTRGQRWRALRMQALERDGWQCVQCGTRRGLECDHVKPVRDRPELAFVLSNLQILCGAVMLARRGWRWVTPPCLPNARNGAICCIRCSAPPQKKRSFDYVAIS